VSLFWGSNRGAGAIVGGTCFALPSQPDPGQLVFKNTLLVILFESSYV
jgi:hypothetical protein